MGSKTFEEIENAELIAEKQSIIVGGMIHKLLPVGKYPFRLREIVTDLIHSGIEVSNVCRDRKEFKDTWVVVSDVVYKCVCAVVDEHMKDYSKRRGGIQSYGEERGT